MRKRGMALRKSVDVSVRILSVLASAVGVFFLVWILVEVAKRGASCLTLSFLLEPTKPYGIHDGGVGNSLVGTAAIIAGASLIGIPVGLLGGVFLSEFGRDSKLAAAVRFCANVLMGVPSVIIGLFVYVILVYTTKHFSGFAGSVALAVIMLPVVMRTTEDMLCMVPNTLRESALALGAPRWRVTLEIVFRAAKAGLVTGVLLAVARVGGETAPLLFTALWSDSWPGLASYFTEPTGNLTVTITEYATNSPFPVMHARAWGAALLITVGVLALNLTARILSKEKK